MFRANKVRCLSNKMKISFPSNGILHNGSYWERKSNPNVNKIPWNMWTWRRPCSIYLSNWSTSFDGQSTKASKTATREILDRKNGCLHIIHMISFSFGKSENRKINMRVLLHFTNTNKQVSLHAVQNRWYSVIIGIYFFPENIAMFCVSFAPK